MASVKERRARKDRVYCELCHNTVSRCQSSYSPKVNARICNKHVTTLRILSCVEEHKLLAWFTPASQQRILLMAETHASKLLGGTADIPPALLPHILADKLDRQIDEYDNLKRTSGSCMLLIASSIGTLIAIAKLKQPRQWYKLLTKEAIHHGICRIFRAVECEPR
jgi:hypothetical protein